MDRGLNNENMEISHDIDVYDAEEDNSVRLEWGVDIRKNDTSIHVETSEENNEKGTFQSLIDRMSKNVEETSNSLESEGNSGEKDNKPVASPSLLPNALFEGTANRANDVYSNGNSNAASEERQIIQEEEIQTIEMDTNTLYDCRAKTLSNLSQELPSSESKSEEKELSISCLSKKKERLCSVSDEENLAKNHKEENVDEAESVCFDVSQSLHCPKTYDSGSKECDKLPNICQTCPSTFSEAQCRNDHVAKFQSEENSSRPAASSSAVSPYASSVLRRCNSRRHSTALYAKSKLECASCSMRFSNNEDLNRHVKEQHQHPFLCPLCPKQYKRAKGARQHFVSTHSEVAANKNLTSIGSYSHLYLGRKELAKHQAKVNKGQIGDNNKFPPNFHGFAKGDDSATIT